MEEKIVGTKGKSPKQDKTSTKNITAELPERRKSPYNKLD